jgi:hypothetical protein
MGLAAMWSDYADCPSLSTARSKRSERGLFPRNVPTTYD